MAWRPDHWMQPLRRAAPFVVLLVFATVMFAMALMTSGKGLRSLDVTCNFRLLDSVQSWRDHGFWELGGLLSFRDAREVLPGLPESLYKSQGSLYLIPHAIAHRLWGEAGFWTMVRFSTIAYAALTSLGVSCIAGLLVEERQVVIGQSRRLLPLVMLVAALAAIPQEGIWGSLWNVDDRALSSVLITVAATAAGLAIRLDRRWLEQLAAALLLLSSLGCPRMGVMLAITIGAFSVLGPPSTLLRLRLATLCVCASALHYLRVLVVDSWGLFNLKGSGPLLRFGFTHEVAERGQSKLDYDHLFQAFGFAWRQSQWAIDRLSLATNLQHLAVYGLAAVGLVLLLRESTRHGSRYQPVLVLLVAPALIWTVLIHQSVSEHPDIHAITWSAGFALGWAWLVFVICRWLGPRLGNLWTLFTGSWIGYWLFLWQVQYLLRAYPNLRW